MDIVKLVFLWIIFIISSFIFIYAVIFNGFVFWNQWITKKDYPSIFPIFGGIAGLFAIGLFGQIFHIDHKAVDAPAWIRWAVLIPLVLDYGCLPSIFGFIFGSIWSSISGIFKKTSKGI